jgi:hypothetical protein
MRNTKENTMKTLKAFGCFLVKLVAFVGCAACFGQINAGLIVDEDE